MTLALTVTLFMLKNEIFKIGISLLFQYVAIVVLNPVEQVKNSAFYTMFELFSDE